MKHEAPKPTVTVHPLGVAQVEREVAEMRRILALFDEHAELSRQMHERGLDLLSSARTMTDIAQYVAAKHGLSVAELTGRRRYRLVVIARHEAMWMMRQRKTAAGRHRWSLPQIGAYFGVDHSSVIHGCKAHERRLAEGLAA